MEVSETDEY